MSIRPGDIAPDFTPVIILASVTDEQAREAYPDGWRAERPYFRYVPDPSGPAQDAA